MINNDYFEHLKKTVCFYCQHYINDGCVNDNCDFKNVEKALKALEIIKKYYSLKEVKDDLFPYYLEDCQFSSSRGCHSITKEEYDLLNEVF